MTRFKKRHRFISKLNDINIVGFRMLAHYTPKILIPKPTGSLIIKTIYGFLLNINPKLDKGVENSLYYTGTYEKGTLHIIKQLLNEKDIFIDIGANIGLMSIFASYLVKSQGKVIAFEPNPETRRILNENIALNNLKNIEVSEFAIGSKHSLGKIYDDFESSRGSASLIKPSNSTNDGYDVKIIKLMHYFTETPKIKVIKIDVEGFEYEVLLGLQEILQSNFPPMLIIEYSNITKDTDKKNNIYQFLLDQKNYKIFIGIGTKGRTSKLKEILTKNDLPLHDNIYCFSKKHIENLPKKMFK